MRRSERQRFHSMSGFVLSAQCECDIIVWLWRFCANALCWTPRSSVRRGVELWHNFYSCGWAWLTLAGLDLYISQSVYSCELSDQEEESSLLPPSLPPPLSLFLCYTTQSVSRLQQSLSSNQPLLHTSFLSQAPGLYHVNWKISPSVLSLLLYISSPIEILNCYVWDAGKSWINSTQLRRLLSLHLLKRLLSFSPALFI